MIITEFHTRLAAISTPAVDHPDPLSRDLIAAIGLFIGISSPSVWTDTPGSEDHMLAEMRKSYGWTADRLARMIRGFEHAETRAAPDGHLTDAAAAGIPDNPNAVVYNALVRTVAIRERVLRQQPESVHAHCLSLWAYLEDSSEILVDRPWDTVLREHLARLNAAAHPTEGA